MSFSQLLDSKQKALAINLNSEIYGSFAEIGAGQEVARHFFRAGGAAGTIAKSISAYDMVVSDAIYGKSSNGRYVCEARLVKMLDREFDQVVERLGDSRDKNTKFFAFADTVAAKSFSGKGECHCWMGMKFQHKAKSAPTEIIIHVNMMDKDALQQQEAIGTLGVNLLHGIYTYSDNPEQLIKSLMDGLSTERLEIDMVRVTGPAFKNIDSRVLSLELVKNNFCKTVIFDESGKVVQASDALYKKNLLVLRGSFRPPTHVNIDMLKTGLNKFKSRLPKEEHSSIITLAEISMSKLLERGEVVSTEDFLARVDLLSALGQKVIISNRESFFALNTLLSKKCKRKIAFVMGIYNLEEIFDEAHYEKHPESLMGAVGNLFGDTTEAYVYPSQDEVSKDIKVIENINVHQKYTFLLMHLLENEHLHNITDYNPDYFTIWSRVVLKMIEEGKPGWEEMVPKEVAKIVKKKSLFLK